MRVFALVLAIQLFGAPPMQAQSCAPKRTALVLSGGGAKGLAHIGVLRALDSLGIRPDLIVGTSMGAIVGGLYASGYSAAEIDSLARTLPLTRLFRTYEPRVPASLGLLQPAVVWEQEPGGLVFQRAAVLEAEVNALLNAGFLRGNLVARGRFDSLPIPFRAVATDLLSGAPVVFATGDLAQAVRASAAIPLLFKPEIVNGRALGDGGLSANVPIAIARQAGAGRVIVSYTTEGTPDSLNLQSTFVLIDHLIGNLFRQPADSLGPEDLPIRPDVTGFQSLDFTPSVIATLIAHGFDAAYPKLRDVTACLPQASTPDHRHDQFILQAVSFDGARGSDSTRLMDQLELTRGEPLVMNRLRRGLRLLGESDRFNSVWLFPHGDRDSLVLRITPRRVPSRLLAVGGAYDNDLGGRVWLGHVSRHPFGTEVEISQLALLGELGQELRAGFRIPSAAMAGFVPVLTLSASRELVRRFDAGDEISPLKVHEGSGFAGLQLNSTRSLQVSIGIAASMWDAPLSRGQATAGARFRIAKAGRYAEPLFQLTADATSAYQRVEAEGIGTIRMGRLQLRPRVRLGIGESLPAHLMFVFGGVDGFAGRHIGELRSERELSGSLVFLYPISGEVMLRVEPMIGATGGDSGLLPQEEPIAGVRLGFNLTTGLGPIRVEYGVSEGGRDGLLVRIGRWF